MTRPIFVLGLQRSGTTWIGNLLAAHPDVAAITAPRHNGIHESLFFSHFAKAWDWTTAQGRDAAITAFLHSDYGRMLDLTADNIARIRATTTPGGAFTTAMDLLARRIGATHWVEKSPHHTRCAQEIAEAIPHARFVAIHRHTPSLLTSRLGAYGRTPPKRGKRAKAILRAAAANAFHACQIDALDRAFPGRVLRVDFEALRKGRNRAVAELIRELGLTPAPGLTSDFPANRTDKGRKLSRLDYLLATSSDRLVRPLPNAVLTTMRRAAAEPALVFPHWVWPQGTTIPRGVTVAAPGGA